MVSSNVGERIAFIAKTFCKSKAEFAAIMGEKPQNIQNWIKRGASNKTLYYILSKFQMVNEDWLINGIGVPFNDYQPQGNEDVHVEENNPQSELSQDEPASPLEAITNLTQVVLLQQQKIKELEDEIARLKAKE